MKKLLVIVLILCSIHRAEAAVAQFIALSGGTPGIGARYAVFAGPLCANGGILINFRYSSDGTTIIKTIEQGTYITPNVGLSLLPFRKRHFRGAAKLSAFLPIKYDQIRYRYGSDSTASRSDGVVYDLALSPGLELYLFEENTPRVSAEFGLFNLYPLTPKYWTFEVLCSISVYIRQLGRRAPGTHLRD